MSPHNGTDLYAPVLAAIANEGLHLVFPEPLTPSAEQLMRTLGVTWSVDPDAPVLGEFHDPFNRGPDRHKRRRNNTPVEEGAA